VRDPHVHTVLVVDDHAAARDALVFFMEGAGVAALGVGSGDEALARLHGGWRPCGIVADLAMPDMDGWTLVERIRSAPALADLPVVVLSGREPDPRRVAALGIRAAFVKPAFPDDVLAAVTGACAGGPITSHTRAHPAYSSGRT
jgi:CheY-like chemotaxis protein